MQKTLLTSLSASALLLAVTTLMPMHATANEHFPTTDVNVNQTASYNVEGDPQDKVLCKYVSYPSVICHAEDDTCRTGPIIKIVLTTREYCMSTGGEVLND